jgi:hypothetical protein
MWIGVHAGFSERYKNESKLPILAISTNFDDIIKDILEFKDSRDWRKYHTIRHISRRPRHKHS